MEPLEDRLIRGGAVCWEGYASNDAVRERVFVDDLIVVHRGGLTKHSLFDHRLKKANPIRFCAEVLAPCRLDIKFGQPAAPWISVANFLSPIDSPCDSLSFYFVRCCIGVPLLVEVIFPL